MRHRCTVETKVLRVTHVMVPRVLLIMLFFYIHIVVVVSSSQENDVNFVIPDKRACVTCNGTSVQTKPKYFVRISISNTYSL